MAEPMKTQILVEKTPLSDEDAKALPEDLRTGKMLPLDCPTDADDGIVAHFLRYDKNSKCLIEETVVGVRADSRTPYPSPRIEPATSSSAS
jgi:hypothetical protein